MREIVLDTYAGEGPLNIGADDWPNFKHIYFKVCEGAHGHLDSPHDLTRETIRQIVDEVKVNDFDSIGIYHYPRRHDHIHWKTQAEAYLRQCDILDSAGVEVDYDVLDIEKANLVNENGQFPHQLGGWMQEIHKFVSNRTQRPYFLYCGPFTRRDAFYKFGHDWIDKLPWICSQYPYQEGAPDETVMERWQEAVDGDREPNTHPVDFPVTMWQVTDRFPAGDWFPDSRAADVNVWIADWQKVLGKSLLQRLWRAIELRLIPR